MKRLLKRRASTAIACVMSMLFLAQSAGAADEELLQILLDNGAITHDQYERLADFSELTNEVELEIGGWMDVDIFGFVMGYGGFKLFKGEMDVDDGSYDAAAQTGIAPFKAHLLSIAFEQISLFAGAGGEFVRAEDSDPDDVEIKVLGPGCVRCNQLEQDLISVMTEIDMPADIEHITDIAEIGSYGVMGTPALVINREVKAVGSVPPKPKLKKWLQDAFAQTAEHQVNQ